LNDISVPKLLKRRGFQWETFPLKNQFKAFSGIFVSFGGFCAFYFKKSQTCCEAGTENLGSFKDSRIALKKVARLFY
jgi:hypothetical protein